MAQIIMKEANEKSLKPEEIPESLPILKINPKKNVQNTRSYPNLRLYGRKRKS